MTHRLTHLSLRGGTGLRRSSRSLQARCFFAKSAGRDSLPQRADDFAKSCIASHVKLNQQRLRQLLAPGVHFADALLKANFSTLAATKVKTRAKTLAEAMGYRRSSLSQQFCVASAASGRFILTTRTRPPVRKHVTPCKLTKMEDRWFCSTLEQAEAYNVSRDTNRALKTTKIWFNISYLTIPASHRRHLVAINLTRFLTRFIARSPANTQAILIDQHSTIQLTPILR